VTYHQRAHSSARAPADGDAGAPVPNGIAGSTADVMLVRSIPA